MTDLDSFLNFIREYKLRIEECLSSQLDILHGIVKLCALKPNKCGQIIKTLATSSDEEIRLICSANLKSHVYDFSNDASIRVRDMYKSRKLFDNWWYMPYKSSSDKKMIEYFADYFKRGCFKRTQSKFVQIIFYTDIISKEEYWKYAFYFNGSGVSSTTDIMLIFKNGIGKDLAAIRDPHFLATYLIESEVKMKEANMSDEKDRLDSSQALLMQIFDSSLESKQKFDELYPSCKITQPSSKPKKKTIGFKKNNIPGFTARP